MGLGPPVCTKCMRVMTLYSEGIPWRCDCGINQNSEECSTLFCMTDEELMKMDSRWGTFDLPMRKYHQEIARLNHKREVLVRQLANNKHATSGKAYGQCWEEAEKEIPPTDFSDLRKGYDVEKM